MDLLTNGWIACHSLIGLIESLRHKSESDNTITIVEQTLVCIVYCFIQNHTHCMHHVMRFVMDSYVITTSTA